MRKALLLGAATLAVASAPAQAADILFASSGSTASSQTVADGGVTQIRMDSGAVVSIVGPAEFSLDGETITLANGGVTVAGGTGSGVVLRLPGGAEATVSGSGSLAVRDGQLSGNVMGGTMQVTTGASTRTYRPGQNWAATVGASSSRVVANAAQPSPNGSARRSPFAATRQTIAQAAMNGLAVTLGEGLAGVGASGDVVAAARGVEAYLANPALARLPSGDVARLLAYSDRLAAALGGGSSFKGASPALVNAYLSYLANNGQIGEFQSAYASLVSEYLTLLANGGRASDFTGADLSQLNSYIRYLQNSGQLDRIGAAQQSLLTAYLDYLRSGGLPDGFVVPANVLTEDAIAAYVSAIQTYLTYLQSGGVPSQYTGLSASVFQAYLEALSSAGLFDTLLAGQADFLGAYLAFLQGGGNIDDFDQLPQTFTFPVPEGQLASGQFMALRGSKAELAPFNGQIDRSRADVIYDESTGAPLYFKFGSTRAAIGEAELTEAGRVSAGGVSWGRWVNGTAYAQTNTAMTLGDNGIHVIAGPMVTNMPATGLIEYDFVGGTNPTLTGGEVGSLSVAKAAISFGSTTRVGAELETDLADRSYTLQTVGGIAQTPQNGIALRQDLAPGFFFGEVLQTTGGLIEVIGSGAACQGSGGCTGEIRGYISGDKAAELAISYIAKDAGGVEVLGTAGFAKGDALATGGGENGGGNTGGGNNGGFSTALVGANFNPDTAGATSVHTYDLDGTRLTQFGVGIGAVTRDQAGKIGTIYINTSASTALLETFDTLDLELLDQRGNDDALLLTYAPGQVRALGSTLRDALDYTLVSAVSDAARFLPTAGSATYSLLHTTPVYTTDPALGEGTFDASLAVVFGALPRVAVEGSIELDTTYTFSIASLADPQFERNFNSTAFIISSPLQGTGAICAQGATCTFYLRGVFGDDYRHIATNWGTLDGSQIYGASIFASDDVSGLSYDAGSGENSGSLQAAFSGTSPAIAYTDGGGSNRKGLNVIAYATPVTAQFDSRGLTTLTLPSGRDRFVRGSELGVADLAGTGRWQVGRYNGGSLESGFDVAARSIWSANSGMSYAVIEPFSGTLPTTGRIDYTLLAATHPVYSNGSTAPGQFSGGMALTLAGTPKVALEGEVTMPDGSYAFATSGGLADPSISNLYFNSAGKNFSGTLTTTTTGTAPACAGSSACYVSIRGVIGGEDGDLATLAYTVFDDFLAARPALSGAAVFGGTLSGGAPNELPEGTTVPDQIVAYASTTIGIDTRGDSEVIYDNTSGAPLAYTWKQNPTTAENEHPNIGTNTQHDSGSVAGIIGWTRWAGGTTGGRYFNDQDGIELPENGGWHVVSGDPATNLPTSGTVTYALVGSTAPTIRDGSLAPGSFAGDLAVAFGATPKVGVEFDVTIGGNAYAINTPGGVADPMNGGMPVGADMRFATQYDQAVYAQGSGPVCNGGDCRAYMQGFLAGDGASHVGIVYTFGNTFDQQVDGSAVFGLAPVP
ncbi:hypothetical protein D2V17_03040 [Aurantiacibacter xanthus]|uniref:Uncharacterized protein n=1 Tax=Aurantiacibacter xanthus TaxID=1784712 RepID=A0A3A1PD26_9SPHN|nr:hypothetical protein [Aurantiacibacter xanthus]RIV91442.1 hypothetical protein D2V17_03040 [Aurantiacibacter xanthus]